MGRLDNRVAFITGGARGQGRAVAAKFASEGADIVICDVPAESGNLPYKTSSKDDLDATAELIRSAGRACIAEVVDVRDQDGLNLLAQRAVDELGGIDILAANAGVASFAPAVEMREEVWQEVIDINLTGVWKSVRAVAGHMMERRQGSIILTSSINSHEALNNMSHYVAAKHGVLGLMRAFALELGPYGIRVNAVAPGMTATPMVDNDDVRESIFNRKDATFDDYLESGYNWTLLRNRSALAGSDIADTTMFLASDESRHVTGVEISVDAGHLILPGYNTTPVKDDVIPPKDFTDTALGHVKGEQPRV